MDRMYRKLLPKVKRPVMVRVVSVDEGGRGGTVELLGYSNAPVGRIDDVDDLKLHRIEPAMLSSRNPLRLTKNVSFLGRVSCEKKFNKRKHVHMIMRSVARKTGFDLEELYTLLNWPTYRLLMNLESRFWDFASSVPASVREALLFGVQNIILHTLRITNPQVLLSSYGLIQDRATCWACAKIRQFESLLKYNDRMPLEDSLSIDDLVYKVLREGLLHKDDHSIDCLSYSENVFICVGIESSQPEAPLYYLREFRVVFDHQYAPDAWDSLLEETASNLRGTIAVSVIWHPSYKNNFEGQAIYMPTDEEIEVYESTPRSKKRTVHTMSLAGIGVHEEDDGTLIPYFELLDSIGDIGVGDCGFVRFARFPVCPIIEFVDMTL